MTDEPQVWTDTELAAAVGRVALKNSVLDFRWTFRFRCLGGGWLLWVEFERPDTEANEPGVGRSRMEYVAAGATVSGVVKTCWLLLELTVRHELMEGFRFDGARIFNPHNSVFELASIQHKGA